MRNLMAIDYFGSPIESDVGDVMLAAGVKAAGYLDLYVLDIFGGGQAICKNGRQLPAHDGTDRRGRKSIRLRWSVDTKG